MNWIFHISVIISGQSDFERSLISKIFHIDKIGLVMMSTISKFKYYHHDELNEETLLKFAEVLPSVTELHFCRIKFSADNVITFMNKCSKLKYIRFELNHRNEYNNLMNMMEPEWRSTNFNRNYITLER